MHHLSNWGLHCQVEMPIFGKLKISSKDDNKGLGSGTNIHFQFF